MSLFQNGHLFNLAITCSPPAGSALPIVAVEMAGRSGRFKSVVGKVDTGASRTILNFDTAQDLGIGDPAASPIRTGKARTATDESFTYYVHKVMVKIGNGTGQGILFPLQAAFADDVPRNLFGVDWLGHLCLAVDRRAVHFLKD